MEGLGERDASLLTGLGAREEAGDEMESNADAFPPPNTRSSSFKRFFSLLYILNFIHTTFIHS